MGPMIPFDFSIPPIASGIEIGLLVLGLALSAVAGLLTKPPKQPVGARTQPTLASRGCYIPYHIGTFRVGGVFAWVGPPATSTKKSGGLFGFGSVKTKLVSQPGWHLLCVGPCDKLTRIYQQGKVIFPTGTEKPLDRTAFPSGSRIILQSKQGNFYIYWGDQTYDKPNQFLATEGIKISVGMNIPSNFPNVCYVVWQNKQLAVANQWPTLEYEIERRPRISESIISGTAWVPGVPLATGNPIMKENGSNPMHALIEIMCAPWPQGLGIPSSCIGIDFFNAMQAKCTTEGLYSNVLVQNGDEAKVPINAILSDIGAVMPQVGDKLIVYLVRQESSVPTLPDAALIPPLPEKVFLQGPQPTNRTTFVFSDRLLNYKPNDITVDDDASYIGVSSKAVQTQLDSVIDQAVATIIADRKQMESLVRVKTYTITAGRGARALSPGQVIYHPDFGQVRISTVERKDQSATIVLECIQDLYAPNAQGISTANASPSNIRFSSPDAALIKWVVPYDLVPQDAAFSECHVQFFPIRWSNHTAQSDIYGTFDSGTAPIYNLLASNNALFMLGKLTTAVDAYGRLWTDKLPISSDSYRLEVNLYSTAGFDAAGAALSDVLDHDIDMFPDLTNYPERWRNGENCAAIEDVNGNILEIVYFKSISVSPNTYCYYLNGILRRRVVKATPPDFTNYSGRVVLFRKQDLAPVPIPNPTLNNSWSSTNAFRAKSLVMGVDGTANAKEGNAVTSGQLFASFSPLPPANFRSIDADSGYNKYSWASGSACTFKWTNRPMIQGIGASCGTQLAGVAIPKKPIPFEGTLTIKIYTNSLMTTLKRTFNVTAGQTQKYTAAQITADGTGSSFYATYQVDVHGHVGNLFGHTFVSR